MFQDILIRPHPPGRYTAQVAGIPEIRVEAASPQEAIDRIRELMREWFKDAKMVRVNIPMDNRLYPSEDFPPKPKDPNDPLEREYLEELARMKKEDLERTLREYEQECPKDPNDPVEHEYWKALVARMRRDMPDMAGHAKDDPLFDEYVEEIARARREEDEREQEKKEPCPNSSSTPTT